MFTVIMLKMNKKSIQNCLSVFSFRSQVLEHMQLTTWEKFYLIREVTLLRVVPLQKVFGNVKQNNVGIWKALRLHFLGWDHTSVFSCFVCLKTQQKWASWKSMRVARHSLFSRWCGAFSRSHPAAGWKAKNAPWPVFGAFLPSQTWPHLPVKTQRALDRR